MRRPPQFRRAIWRASRRMRSQPELTFGERDGESIERMSIAAWTPGMREAIPIHVELKRVRRRPHSAAAGEHLHRLAGGDAGAELTGQAGRRTPALLQI